MVAIPEKGSLKETPLPRLLLDLHSARFDGSVRLNRERLEKSFLFQQGMPIFGESNRASETLGMQLLDSRRITRDDHTRVSAYLQEHRCKEGKALLDLGILDPKTLFVALKGQVRPRLVDCFGWPDGEFAVEPSNAPNSDAQPFRADVYSLIQEGIETHWSTERILGDLSANMSSSVRRTRLLSRVQERLRWDDSVETFVDALDGSQTLWRAVQNARSPRALAAAWVLDAIGGLAYGDSDAPEATDAPLQIEIALPGEAAAQDAAGARASSGQATKQAPDPLDDDLLREISEKHESLGELDHYSVLGIEREAAPAAIKRAYLEAAKRYHPDALVRAGADSEVREQAGKVFAAIGKAHSVLSNAAQRKDYDAQLDSDAPEIDVERLAAAERNFRKAEILMRVGNFRGALEFLEPAVELWPEEAAYQAALGWALYKKAPPEPDRAREHLQRALEIDPSVAGTAFHLSVVFKALGDDEVSAAMLARARTLDPNVG
jgi:tetratricopeptide (TPR) repeat protein